MLNAANAFVPFHIGRALWLAIAAFGWFMSIQDAAAQGTSPSPTRAVAETSEPVVTTNSDDGLTFRLHPENDCWFQWRGKPTALITSAEHYGAVLNSEFDYRRYLAAIHDQGMNYTRIFSGSYVEPQGAFGIADNTLAPAEGKFLAPWRRSDVPGYAGGGNKFDLEEFNPDYLSRLEAFISEADRQGIVVELTLFCSTYSDKQWAVHPLNPANNVQAHDVTDWKKLNTSETSPSILRVQRELTHWLVSELNEFDNLFFEIQNEPWADNHSLGDYINPYLAESKNWANSVEITSDISIAWQREIARAIVEAEGGLPNRHLIGQNVANFQLALRDEDLVPQASVINFHYAYPAAVEWNRNLGRVIGYDESGFAGREDATYRRQAWNFVLSGGGLFNSLDYSFSVGHEAGDNVNNTAPGGGSKRLRAQLRILSDFIHSFALDRLRPDTTTVLRGAGVATRCLSEPGQQYAIYLEGRNPAKLELALPAGAYRYQWTDVQTGETTRPESISVDSPSTVLTVPACSAGIALAIREHTRPSP